MFWPTLNIFLWKQWKALRMHWFANIINIALPILLVFGEVHLFHFVTNAVAREPATFELITEDALTKPPGKLIYAPNTTFTYTLMEEVRQQIGITDENMIPYVTVEECYAALRASKNLRDFAIVFDEPSADDDIKTLKYAVHPRSDHYYTDKTYFNDVFQSTLQDMDVYMQTGFLALQIAIDEKYIDMVAPKAAYNVPIEIEFQKFPSNLRVEMPFIGVLITSTFLLCIYVFTVVTMVLVPMVDEKQSGVKEFLRIASTYSYLNNMWHYVVNVVIGLFIFGVSLAIAGSYGLTTHIATDCLIVLVILFVMSFVSFTFMVSVMFKSVFLAKTGGMLCYILPALLMLSDRTKCLAVLYDLLMVFQAFKIFDSYGSRGLVFTMDNIQDIRPEGGYSMLCIYLILLLHTIVYMIVYYYFVQVFPGPFGTPRPFYFPFQPSFYCRNKVASSDDFRSDNGSDVPLNGEIVVRVRGISKEFRPLFGKPNMAVKNLSMDIYKNQITVLLGHNGAGKTTTMSMISGIIPKSSGTISVDGDEDIHRYRHKIGYCPQHNVFMPYFTCLDHLLFFGGIRGMSKQQAHQQSTILLNKLKLTEKANEYGKNLSGGMKRRLCLGIALIGETQIAILDEPSSGLDPESRRELWNILLDMRKHHSILITTHYMEEAETLADRISIMSHGEVLCAGTSMQLKRQYAVGYIMKLLTTSTFNMSDVMKLIHPYIPDASVKSFVLPTLNITLPYKDLEQYPDMLKNLEQNAARVGVASISMTNASLEEVFLNCDPQSELPVVQHDSVDEMDSSGYTRFEDGNYIDPKKDIAIQSRQFMAIFYKKYIFLREYWYFLLISVSIPIAAIICSFLIINGSISKFDGSRLNTWPAVSLSFTNIKNPIVLLQTGDIQTDEASAFEQALKIILEKEKATLRYLPARELMTEELLHIEKADVTEYHENIVCALHMYKLSDHVYVKTWFSGNSVHGTAIALNLVNNVILQMRTNGKYTVQTINEPLKKEKMAISGRDLDVYLLLVPTSIFFYILFYVFLPFTEESTEFKKLQSVSPFLYWMAYYIFDFIVHSLFCGVLFVVHLACDYEHIFGMKEYTLFSTIPLFYGIAYLPLIYIICQQFSGLSSLYSFFTYMFVVSNMAAAFISGSQENMFTYANWMMVLMVLPDYALRHAINAMFITFAQIQDTQAKFSGAPQDSAEYLNTSRYIGSSDELDLLRYFLYMTFVAVAEMVFLVAVWEDIYRKQWLIGLFTFYKRCRRSKPPARELLTPNEDVREEKDLTDSVVTENNIENYAIVVSNLKKRYDQFEAVRGISFTVKRGECFGLLGMNGAGKTTTFKMMTRDATITQGDIFFNGVNSTKNSSQYKFMLGYCPQNDALNGYMTAYETIKYMALIRGTGNESIDESVMKLLRDTDLVKYADVPVKFYSGGTKRKLNTALAIQSDPCLVFLDEPTTGVDPTSRRFMWACIQECQKQNKNIVLTSHSMDECEHLCNRLAIMTAGQLNCIGPIQQLKDTFALGFLIIIMLKPNREDSEQRTSVKNSMITSFKCKLREEYGNQLSYSVRENNLRWSEVFKRIHSIQRQYDNTVEDISVCETSLEDIFLKIARDSQQPTHSQSVQDSPV